MSVVIIGVVKNKGFAVAKLIDEAGLPHAWFAKDHYVVAGGGRHVVLKTLGFCGSHMKSSNV